MCLVPNKNSHKACQSKFSKYLANMKDVDPKEKWENKTSGWGKNLFSFLSRLPGKTKKAWAAPCGAVREPATCPVRRPGGGRAHVPAEMGRNPGLAEEQCRLREIVSVAFDIRGEVMD